jgi:O-antigen/teichoic acid export membrane protein
MRPQVGLETYRPRGGDARTGDRTSLRAAVKALWSRNQDILANAVSLLGTTGITSLVGFAYWNVAARLFSQQAVGYATAAVSVIMLLSAVGMFGLGALLMGDLPKRSNRAGLISAVVLASGLGSLVLAVGFIVVVPHLSTHFADITGSTGRAALFCAGVSLTAMVLVLDEATIGLLRGGLQLTRNITFVVVKLVALIGAAAVIHDAFGLGILASWVVAIPVSLLPVAVWLRIHHEPVLPKPNWGVLRSLGKTAAVQNWISQASQAPALLIPVLVASIVAPSVNAGFFAAWSISYVLIVLPSHLSTVLFAVGSADTQVIARKLRFSLRMSVLLGIPGMIILGLGAHWILGIFGAGYARVATVPLQLLVLAYPPTIPKLFFVAVCRARGELTRTGTVLTVFAVMEVGGAVIGCLRGGLVGLSAALLVVAVIEAVITIPTVARATITYGRHRRAAMQVAGAGPSGTSAPAARPELAGSRASRSAVTKEERQLVALAVLMSVSSPTAVRPVTGVRPVTKRVGPTNVSEH